MTRKDVCNATGLSVKTLRLYEEKGLIAPEKERRNGKEYWRYTPELVKQLDRIALLRRALFTMDEIRTMQEHPEAISGIVQSYQQWLRLQEQQLHRLRQAADGIRPETISDMDSLIARLREPAAAMPLPATDIKPNFKRLDELDEGPRHVDPQTDLDDMVPNATVFRQVNIMVDRDRGNDTNLALGQLQATVRGFREEPGAGPVQKTRKTPKWCNGLLALLMALTVVFGCLAYFGRLPWLVPGITLLLSAAILAIPMWLDHHKWLKAAQQADAKITSPEAYAKARKKRVYLLAAGTAGVLVLALGIFALAKYLYAQEHPDTDCRLCLASPAYETAVDIPAMEAELAALVGDADGNGAVLTPIDHMELAPGTWRYNGTFMAADLYIESLVESGGTHDLDQSYTLFLLVDQGYGQFNPFQNFKFYDHCARLPEDLRQPESTAAYADRYLQPYRLDLRGTTLMEAAGLSDIPVYACISKSATDEEYEFAVDILRKILAA